MHKKIKQERKQRLGHNLVLVHIFSPISSTHKGPE